MPLCNLSKVHFGNDERRQPSGTRPNGAPSPAAAHPPCPKGSIFSRGTLTSPRALACPFFKDNVVSSGGGWPLEDTHVLSPPPPTSLHQHHNRVIWSKVIDPRGRETTAGSPRRRASGQGGLRPENGTTGSARRLARLHHRRPGSRPASRSRGGDMEGGLSVKGGREGGWEHRGRGGRQRPSGKVAPTPRTFQAVPRKPACALHARARGSEPPRGQTSRHRPRKGPLAPQRDKTSQTSGPRP